MNKLVHVTRLIDENTKNAGYTALRPKNTEGAGNGTANMEDTLDSKIPKTPEKMPGKRKAIGLRVSSHCNQGGRKYMEDVISIVFDRREDSDYACFAVYDGHGGRQAAVFARDHLWENIKKQRGFFSGDHPKVMAAIREGFHVTQAAMEKVRCHWPLTATGYPSTAGTTVAMVVINQNNMYVAHVGDSRIVAGVKNKFDRVEPKALTIDHKPSNRREIERIEKLGGQVLYKNGVPRVVWTRARHSHRGPIRRSTHVDKIPFLAVARSLGDLWSYQFEHEDYLVSPDPDITHHIIDPEHHKFLVIGSDGLWNMMSVYDAVRLTDRYAWQRANRGTTQGMYTTISKELVMTAINKWNARNLRADNTTAITLYFEYPNTLDDENDQIDLASIRKWQTVGLKVYADWHEENWEPPPGGKWRPPPQRYPNRCFNPYLKRKCWHYNFTAKANELCDECIRIVEAEESRNYSTEERTVYMESPKSPWITAYKNKEQEQGKKRKADDEVEINPSKRHKVQDNSPSSDGPMNKEIMVKTVRGMVKVQIFGFGKQAPEDYPKEVKKKTEVVVAKKVEETKKVEIEDVEVEVETEKKEEKSVAKKPDEFTSLETRSNEQKKKFPKEDEEDTKPKEAESTKPQDIPSEGVDTEEASKKPLEQKPNDSNTKEDDKESSNATEAPQQKVVSSPVTAVDVHKKSAVISAAAESQPPVLRKSPRNNSSKLSCLKDSNSVISPLAKGSHHKSRPYNTRNSLSPKGAIKRLLRTVNSKSPAASKRRASLPAKLVRSSSRAVTRSAVKIR